MNLTHIYFNILTGTLLPIGFQDILAGEFMPLHQKHERGNVTHKKVKERHLPRRISPAFDTLEAMIMDDEYASHSRDYPRNTTCSFVGLRKPHVASRVSEDPQEQKCRLRFETPEECKEGIKYYGEPGNIKELKCDVSKAIEICRIERLNNTGNFDVFCDSRHCKGEDLHLGLLGSQTGMVDNWTVISDAKRLGQYLHDHISSSKFGASFALLKCEKSLVFQVLTLPKILERSTMSQRHKNINFNIIVEDSVSRRHFFRTLSQTASTMRNIIYKKSIPATVLEFEKVQSYDTTTKRNIQRLFSGTKYLRPNERDIIGIEDFFSLLKEFGYSTLFQEDNCWYDNWGTLLDLSYRTGHVKDQKERDKIWKEFVDLLEKTKRSDSVDDFGVTFLTCSVYAYLHTSNIFSARDFPNICFAGEHFSSFLLNYAKEYMMFNDNAAKPFLAYTHVITSHERSGRRIVNDDITLSKLLRQAAYMHNTVTILISDHGAKSTKFSSHTTQGRHEVFRPLLFMIIPHVVCDKLGPEAMNALVANQKRLIGIQDLGEALRAYLKPNTPELRGLFLPISLNRTCEQLDLDSDVLCLCDKMDKSISSKSRVLKWAAEFALGVLNNMIQDQFIAGLKTKRSGEIKSNFYGYGACQRYTGHEIGLARHQVAGQQEILAFTLFVQPFDRKTKEVFNVMVSFPVNQDEGISLDKFTRASSFNEYEQCADKNVNPKICTCRRSLKKTFKWRKRFIKNAASQHSFSLAPTGLVLDHPCLTIISRNKQNSLPSGRKQNAISTYEAFNACSYVTYNLTIDIKKFKRSRVSRKLPDTVTLFPRTMTFLITVKNAWRYGVFVPRFSFVKRTLSGRN